jgi:hypothetical protein
MSIESWLTLGIPAAEIAPAPVTAGSPRTTGDR